MKRNNIKKFKGLILASSIAAFGCNVAKGGIMSDIKLALFGFALGTVVAYKAPDVIESQVFDKIDSVIDNIPQVPKPFSKGVKDSLHRQIKERARKEGWFRTIMSLLRVKNKYEIGVGLDIMRLHNALTSEGFDGVLKLIGAGFSGFFGKNP